MEGRKASVRVAALRLLASRRLTEAQLWSRLARKDYSSEEIHRAVAWCKSEGYLDDALFARLYIEARTKAIGDRRLVGELVRRGVDRDVAGETVACCDLSEDERLRAALDAVLHRRPQASYASLARALERLGFPAPSIYRRLRALASQNGFAGALAEDSPNGCE
ncbi:MAG: regulatory protein RecX [Candidatus Eremiobacteraeota bacterium]|nr:regulatory protein RecX [Candidatus Eremiobacteraeota bacterium]